MGSGKGSRRASVLHSRLRALVGSGEGWQGEGESGFLQKAIILNYLEKLVCQKWGNRDSSGLGVGKPSPTDGQGSA